MGKLPGQRVAVLIDGQNLYLSAKTRGAKPDYKAIMNAANCQGNCLQYSYPVKVRVGESVLETADGWLTGQRLPIRKLLAGHLQHRIMSQLIGIIAVFIATGNLEDPLQQVRPNRRCILTCYNPQESMT